MFSRVGGSVLNLARPKRPLVYNLRDSVERRFHAWRVIAVRRVLQAPCVVFALHSLVQLRVMIGERVGAWRAASVVENRDAPLFLLEICAGVLVITAKSDGVSLFETSRVIHQLMFGEM